MSAISLQEVSKAFRVSHEKPALIRELLPHGLRRRHTAEHWALRGVTLDIAPGTTVGLVGPNGAGKTTLLSVMAGITRPTRGRVEVRGTLAPLLGLGGGFHPELTGLENIFLNGSLLGMRTREIRRKLDSMVAFSQLDGFIDAPLQTYSSGMQLRLGFAVAIHAEADILLVDEVMTVGDRAFQARCLERLRALKRAGKTLLLVSHGFEIFKALADRVLLLHEGRLIADGSVGHVYRRYAVLMDWLGPTARAPAKRAQAAIQDQLARQDPQDIARRWGRREGTGGVEIAAVRLLDETGHEARGVPSGHGFTVAIRLRTTMRLPNPHIGVAIFRDDRIYCYGPNTRTDGWQFRDLPAGGYECRCTFNALRLTPGGYRLSVAVWDEPGDFPYVHHMAEYPLRVTGHPAEGVAVLAHAWRVVSAAPDSATSALRVEGPGGDQVWYRTFEPLRLTARLGPRARVDAAVRAECRGARGELWWASTWSPPAEAVGAGASPGVEVECAQLPLLTGRYRWSVGWEDEDAARRPTRTIEVLADRPDHGLLFLPHRWELARCEERPQAAESPPLEGIGGLTAGAGAACSRRT